MNRIRSIDFLRGLVMIIMALDHVRDLVHITATTQEPLDFTTTTPSLFMTRWITHLCAPTFVFLSGTSAYLSMLNQNNFVENRNFLFKRGLWLIFLNFTIVNFGIFFDVKFGILFSQVIAAIGFGQIILAILMKIQPKLLGMIGLVIIFSHNLFQNFTFDQTNPISIIWAILTTVKFYQITPNFAFLTAYPYIQWTAIMLAGYGFGTFFNLSSQNRKQLFLKIGLAAISLFIILRFINSYGDPNPWTVQKNNIFTFLSFINITKQAPSLLYTLITLGISITLLSIFESVKNRLTDIISVYGKVPLFYYMIHWYLIHLVAIGVYLMQGYSFSELQFNGFNFGHPKNGGGLELFGTYLTWIAIVVALFPFCKWFWQYKMRHKNKTWLKYF
jgi:uncharacterized membrane protein